jgi:hypothetical protein
MFEILLVLAAVIIIPALFLNVVRFLRENGFFGVVFPRGMEKVWYVAAALLGLVVLMIGFNSIHGPGEEETFAGLGILVLAVFVYLWQREFQFLMRLRDDDFPGRFDKPIWAFVLTALAPVGFWLFRSYRLAHWPEPKVESIRGAAADLS